MPRHRLASRSSLRGGGREPTEPPYFLSFIPGPGGASEGWRAPGLTSRQERGEAKQTKPRCGFWRPAPWSGDCPAQIPGHARGALPGVRGLLTHTWRYYYSSDSLENTWVRLGERTLNTLQHLLDNRAYVFPQKQWQYLWSNILFRKLGTSP